MVEWDRLVPRPYILAVSTNNFCPLIPSPLDVSPASFALSPYYLAPSPLTPHGLVTLLYNSQPLTVSTFIVHLVHIYLQEMTSI